ncbi:MAG: hypothetical protein JWQ22_1515 [Devosia sp.]|nr:hypothetical protein [Devosia sp.]
MTHDFCEVAKLFDLVTKTLTGWPGTMISAAYG